MTPEPTAPIDAQIEATEDTADQVDEVAEALALQSIISDERHEEIMEEVDKWRSQLEVLSQRERAEDPMLSQIRAEVTQLRERMEILLSGLEAKLLSQRQSESVETPPETPATPAPVESTAEPVREETPPTEAPPKRRRFLKI